VFGWFRHGSPTGALIGPMPDLSAAIRFASAYARASERFELYGDATSKLATFNVQASYRFTNGHHMIPVLIGLIWGTTNAFLAQGARIAASKPVRAFTGACDEIKR
jgi:hypothetical protein